MASGCHTLALLWLLIWSMFLWYLAFSLVVLLMFLSSTCSGVNLSTLPPLVSYIPSLMVLEFFCSRKFTFFFLRSLLFSFILLLCSSYVSSISLVAVNEDVTFEEDGPWLTIAGDKNNDTTGVIGILTFTFIESRFLFLCSLLFLFFLFLCSSCARFISLVADKDLTFEGDSTRLTTAGNMNDDTTGMIGILTFIGTLAQLSFVQERHVLGG